MKLKIKNVEKLFDLNLNHLLVIENISFFRSLIINDETNEDFSLINDNGVIESGKFVRCLYNYFDIDLNQKNFFSEFLKMNKFALSDEIKIIENDITELIEKFISIIRCDSPIDLDYDNFEISQLFKNLKIRFSNDYSLLEKLVYFIKLSSEFLKIKVFVFFNLHLYFSLEEINSLKKEMSNLNVKYLNITSYNGDFYNESDIIKTTIDNDLCEF